MTILVIPDIVVIRLVDLQGGPIPLANVLLSVHIFANKKNDFFLQPFATDANGIATITQGDMLAEVDAHYDSGLMDYYAVESCKPDVEIEIIDSWKIERALVSRTTIWNTLLKGESQRWKTLENLCNLYRTATNNQISGKPVAARWDGTASQFEYTMTAELQ